MTSVIKNRRTSLERIEKFISPIYFVESNLYGRLYTATAPLASLSHFAANGRLPFKESVETGQFSEAKVGLSYGPTWSTHWFKVEVHIPDNWMGKEVHLQWDCGCEALLWSHDGHPLQGLSEKRKEYVITYSANLDDLRKNYYIEMACNTLFGAGKGSMIAPPDPDKYFVLQKADIVVVDRLVYDLLMDLETLHQIVKSLPEDHYRGYDALYTANNIINIIQVEGRNTESYLKGRELARAFWAQRGGQTGPTLVAVGNCHIDCAWLWPYEETVRKCARSWASVVSLMDRFPDFKFACSQAQQFMWVKENYPHLYDRVKHYVSQGRFLPVGGSWVEMDGNLPSGESFVRQILYGQRFFEREFGKRCKELWLPDTFGYSAQLPQILKLFNMERFLTQKLSWSLVNKFPHDNFIWQGIDGSSVLVHFPPAQSYDSEITAEEAIKAVKNLKDKGQVSHGMLLFGHGDGGGGPTAAMLERQQRLKDCDGLPRVKLGSPDEVFSSLEPAKLCRWVGELFLELHQGTYTSQARMKGLNRECEGALRQAEFLQAVLLALAPSRKYPQLELERLWKILLLNQFHDVLPGTSIAEVHKDALFYFSEVLKGARALQQGAVLELFGPPVLGEKKEVEKSDEEVILINSLSWPRTELIPLCPEDGAGDKEVLAAHTVIPMGYKLLRNAAPIDIPAPLSAEHRSDGTFHIRSHLLQVVLDSQGRLTSLRLTRESGLDLATGQPYTAVRPPDTVREAIAPGCLANQLVLFDDIPLYWDAWDVMDYHLQTRRTAITEVLKPLKFVEVTPLRVSLKFRAKLGSHSRISQKIVIDAVHPYVLFDTRITWGETHKFLKVEFPVNVLAPHATYDIQFGHVQRPTHFNTSWDSARFEVWGHKWMDLSEHDWGVALINTSKYGYSCHGNVMRLSLLRAPKSPDPHADQGEHRIVYALMPHYSTFQQAGVIQQAYQLHCPVQLHRTPSSAPRALPLDICHFFSWFQISTPAVIIDTIKKAEDRAGCLCMRLHEAYGSRVTAVLRSTLPLSKVILCNGYEDVAEDPSSRLDWRDGSVKLSFTPFQILSLLLYSDV